ncbi:MAG: hypothetical protein LAN62_12600 [Acidobacteriia bacterium]|nr:hypothetical protein [Terriglobia bacterium]
MMSDGRPVARAAQSSSTRKKVVVRKLDGEAIKGYVDSVGCLGLRGVEVLDREGRMISVPLETIRAVYFVRDFDGGLDRSERRVFLSRPRLGGIWIRMTFKDHEVMDGIMANNLLEFDSSGFLVTPPDFTSNNVRVFVPRAALETVEVLGVISDGSARRAAGRVRRLGAKRAPEGAQFDLFPAERESPSE